MKHKFLVLALLVLGCLVVVLLSPNLRPASSKPAAVVASHDDDDDDDNDISESEVRRGLRIAPVPLNLHHRNRALVGLGSYIVNAQGGCNDCHTNPSYLPGGDPHLGQPEHINGPCYLSGGQHFGPFVSRNLTPNGQGLPAGLTFDEFLNIIRTGIDDDNLPPHVPPPPAQDLLQVMPWPVYGKMSRLDLRAVYEYLSAIPSRPTCN
jgi:hypothetical protein